MPIDPNRDSAGSFHAPGRVNLIGEHTDYTGGLVLPMAIPFATTAIVQSNTSTYVFTSDNFSGTREIALGQETPSSGNWSDYCVGVLSQLQALGITPPPFRLNVSGNIPLGAGLSSSASLEVVTAVALLSHSGKTLPVEDIALLCQRAENQYVGSPCGIMDQFVIAAATQGHALLLNTRDLTYTLLPMNEGALAGCVVVIANSGVKHSVATGEYGSRRQEVEAGQTVVCARFPNCRDLGDVTLDQLRACEHEMSQLSFLRCRHIVTENERVRQAGLATEAGDAARLGELMTAAHQSYRDDFGASVEEVDFLVDTALNLDGCHGARLTGGGFGGCIVALVKAENAKTFSESLQTAYFGKFGIKADTWICEAVDGAVAQMRKVAGGHDA